MLPEIMVGDPLYPTIKMEQYMIDGLVSCKIIPS